MENLQLKPRNHIVEHISIIVLLSILLISISAILNTNSQSTQEGKFLIPKSVSDLYPSTQVLSAHAATFHTQSHINK